MLEDGIQAIREGGTRGDAGVEVEQGTDVMIQRNHEQYGDLAMFVEVPP